jgi:hypothetical protein
LGGIAPAKVGHHVKSPIVPHCVPTKSEQPKGGLNDHLPGLTRAVTAHLGHLTDMTTNNGGIIGGRKPYFEPPLFKLIHCLRSSKPNPARCGEEISNNVWAP